MNYAAIKLPRFWKCIEPGREYKNILSGYVVRRYYDIMTGKDDLFVIIDNNCMMLSCEQMQLKLCIREADRIFESYIEDGDIKVFPLEEELYDIMKNLVLTHGAAERTVSTKEYIQLINKLP